MTMTNEEILSAAARLRAARRRRTARQCDVCGTSFEGIAQRRYCSDACRVRAARVREAVSTEDTRGVPQPLHRATPHEAERPLTPRDTHESALEYLSRVRAWLSTDATHDDSTQMLREVRAERDSELEQVRGKVPMAIEE